jgi:hypothetical protein
MKGKKDPLITLDEAAMLTGRTRTALRKWIQRKHVAGFYTGTGWLVRQSELLAAHDRIRVRVQPVPMQRPALRVIEQVPLISKPAPAPQPAPGQAVIEQLGALTVSLAVLRHKLADEIEPALFGHLTGDLQWLLSKLQ